ncbi:hypothetical protein BJ085DRAFT_34059 [Dimargaris cristalligena]|uniref:Uncharacterized protein n=1 Tax=Dimargaris cristalligena TaxID=215637 RepID=A0A4P9ZRR6_9FUNG|nr:hypothetical protein BJ085DRAFT_34059 [Dimargaris cristalligena]|eukprot:RKP36065.1 hypothetical protein BJ085DRAFT_34059 [Dimargaris cristalligena]
MPKASWVPGRSGPVAICRDVLTRYHRLRCHTSVTRPASSDESAGLSPDPHIFYLLATLRKALLARDQKASLQAYDQLVDYRPHNRPPTHRSTPTRPAPSTITRTLLDPWDYQCLLNILEAQPSRPNSQRIIAVSLDMEAAGVSLTIPNRNLILRAHYLLAEYAQAVEAGVRWHIVPNDISDLTTLGASTESANSTTWYYLLSCYAQTTRDCLAVFQLYSVMRQHWDIPPTFAVLYRLIRALAADVRWHESAFEQLTSDLPLCTGDSRAQQTLWASLIISLLQTHRWLPMIHTLELSYQRRIFFAPTLYRHVFKRLHRCQRADLAQRLWQQAVRQPQPGVWPLDQPLVARVLPRVFPCLSISVLNAHLDGLVKVGALDDAESVFADLQHIAYLRRRDHQTGPPITGLSEATPDCDTPGSMAALASTAASGWWWKQALSFLAPDAYTFTIMITGYMHQFNLTKVYQLVREFNHLRLPWDRILLDVLLRGLVQFHYTYGTGPADLLGLTGVGPQNILDLIRMDPEQHNHPSTTVTQLYHDLIHHTVLATRLDRIQRSARSNPQMYQDAEAAHRQSWTHLMRTTAPDQPVYGPHGSIELGVALTVFMRHRQPDRAMSLYQRYQLADPTGRAVLTPVLANQLIRGLLDNRRYVEAHRVLDTHASFTQRPRLRQEGYRTLLAAYAAVGDLEGTFRTFFRLCELDPFVRTILPRFFTVTGAADIWRLPDLPELPTPAHHPSATTASLALLYDSFDPLIHRWQTPSADDWVSFCPVPLSCYLTMFNILFRLRYPHYARRLLTLLQETIRLYTVWAEHGPDMLRLHLARLDPVEPAEQWTASESTTSAASASVSDSPAEPSVPGNSAGAAPWLHHFHPPRWNRQLAYVLLKGWLHLHQMKHARYTLEEMARQQVIPNPQSALEQLVEKTQAILAGKQDPELH